MQKNPENFEGLKWPLCKRRRHQSLLTHSWPMHITKCVFQYCLLLCSVEFQLDFPLGLPAMPRPPTGLLEGCKWIPLLVPKMVRFKFLSYCDAFLTEVKGSLEVSERSMMSACLLPHACLPWSLRWALGPPHQQVTGWLCSPVWSCAKLARGGIWLAESSRACLWQCIRLTLWKGQECPRAEESAALLVVKNTSAASFMAVGPTWVCSELVQ